VLSSSWDERPFDHNRHGPKIGRGGECAPLRELGPHLTQRHLGRGLPSYQVGYWSIQPFGHNRYSPKIRRDVPVWGGGAGSPSNTVWPGPRLTFTPSFIVLHQTFWPQYTNVTDRQDRTDSTGQTNGQDRQRPIALGEPFYKRWPKMKRFSPKCSQHNS